MAEKCITQALLTFPFLGSYYPVANINTSSFFYVTVGVFACCRSVFSCKRKPSVAVIQPQVSTTF